MNRDDLVQDIGALLVRDPQISSQPWEDLVIVAQITRSSTKANGFAYSASGDATPTGPGNLDVLDKLEDLRLAMREPGKEPWKACLVRINKSTSHIVIDFEYDHPDRWLITPATLERMAEVLRPTEP